MAPCNDKQYDVVIVGGGISAAMIAKQLGLAGKRVLIVEAGAPIPANINADLERFYTAAVKVPESPYTPDIVDPPGSMTPSNPNLQNTPRATTAVLNANDWQNPDASTLIQKGPLPFSSTYERVAGGTTRHWLGTSLRFLPNDFKMATTYPALKALNWPDWPLTYDDLVPWYGQAEHEIGISADKNEQAYLGITFPADYEYPMPKILQSALDTTLGEGVTGMQLFNQPVTVTSTPQGRNSRPYQDRRVCAGNTNCIPICPIGAKYDATVTLKQALNTGHVDILYQTVATEILVDTKNGLITHINCVQYDNQTGEKTGDCTVSGTIFVVAAHAIETPKLLLMSNKQLAAGIANRSGLVGKNLMDHPIYLAWALMPDPIFPYRGPLSTSGIESLRDGPFRNERAAFRIEIGNEGWNFPIGDPYTTTLDFINGENKSALNPQKQQLFGRDLVKVLNQNFVRQFRLGFLVEQEPETSNYIVPSQEYTDHLGIPRPEIHYNLSEYTKRGFAAARQAADAIFDRLGATQFTSQPDPQNPTYFEIDGEAFTFFGAGHIVGTYTMGTAPSNSVVGATQKTWDHDNLYLVGSGVFPTVTTANPTLTITALALLAADSIKKDLG